MEVINHLLTGMILQVPRMQNEQRKVSLLKSSTQQRDYIDYSGVQGMAFA